MMVVTQVRRVNRFLSIDLRQTTPYRHTGVASSKRCSLY